MCGHHRWRVSRFPFLLRPVVRILTRVIVMSLLLFSFYEGPPESLPQLH